MKVIRIPEREVPGRRLGRHVRHDPRSLAYQVAAVDPATLTSVRHVRGIPVLDQGDLGSCTGNAAEGCLGSAPFLGTLQGLPGCPTPDADADTGSHFQTSKRVCRTAADWKEIEEGTERVMKTIRENSGINPADLAPGVGGVGPN